MKKLIFILTICIGSSLAWSMGEEKLNQTSCANQGDGGCFLNNTGANMGNQDLCLLIKIEGSKHRLDCR